MRNTMTLMVLSGLSIFSLFSCGQSAAPLIDQAVSQSKMTDQELATDIQRRLDNGTLKPSFFITKDQGVVSGQAITGNGGGSCSVVNLTDSPIAGVISGHSYISCNVKMPYIELSNYIQDVTAVPVRSSAVATDYRNTFVTSMLLTTKTLSYIKGRRYCTNSVGSVLFPGDTSLTTGTGTSGCLNG